MSAAGAVQGAVAAALAAVAGLNRVEPGASVRATPPYAEFGPIEARDWGTKDRAGREVKVTVVIRDLAERAARLDGLGEAAAAAVAGMPREVADADLSWRIASCVFVRSRMASEKAGLWAATLEWRVRILAE